MSEDNGKLTQIPNVEKDKLIAQMENLKRNMPTLIEMQGHLAKIKYASFVAYVDAGFTADQALQLTKG
jgi:hypothetical protein